MKVAILSVLLKAEGLLPSTYFLSEQMNEFSKDTQLLIKEANPGMTHSRQSSPFESLKILTFPTHRAKDDKGRNLKSQENGG